jgi:hypothetical protein
MTSEPRVGGHHDESLWSEFGSSVEAPHPPTIAKAPLLPRVCDRSSRYGVGMAIERPRTHFEL